MREIMTQANWNFETLQIHAGQTPDSETGARALPIYQSTAFVFDDAAQAAGRFALAEPGNIYTRITNPTQAAIENRLAALEGGAAGLLLASGQSATTLAILNIAQAGDHVVASPWLYGGTLNLLTHTLTRYGIDVTYVEDPSDPDSWRAAANERTKLFFGETIPNPRGSVLDLEAIADAAHAEGVPFIVDNTIATPYVTRPFEHGADVVIHSATKFLGGHGTSMGGIVIEKGDFDWKSGRFPTMSEPDASYHGITWGDLGAGAFVTRIRTTLLRDMGPAISPFNAFLIGLGVETLSLRMEKHLENTRKVAEFLEGHEQVESITWASLPSSPYYDLAQKYTPKGAGSIIAFVLKGGKEAGVRFVDGLTLHSNVANIGDVRSLVIHPASTTHSQLTEAELESAGAPAGLVRLSVGLEHIDDIIADLSQSFDRL